MRREPWIALYARKGKLTKEQHAAAANLYAAWAGFPARDPLAALSGKVDALRCDDPLATQYDRRRWFFSVWKDIPRASRPVVEHVVLRDLSLRSMAGCYNGLTEARYMQRLIDGLDAII